MSAAAVAKQPAGGKKPPAAAPADGEPGFEKVKRKLSGKRMVFLIIAPFLVLATLVGFMFTPAALGIRQTLGLAPKQVAVDAPPPVQKQIVFMDLPDMIVNLNTGTRQSSFLKLRVALEVDDPALLPKLKALEPRIIDNFQIYLRDLRREDLDGSAGMARLKEELLLRINVAVRPARINDVLFNEILVQ